MLPLSVFPSAWAGEEEWWLFHARSKWALLTPSTSEGINHWWSVLRDNSEYQTPTQNLQKGTTHVTADNHFSGDKWLHTVEEMDLVLPIQQGKTVTPEALKRNIFSTWHNKTHTERDTRLPAKRIQSFQLRRLKLQRAQRLTPTL